MNASSHSTDNDLIQGTILIVDDMPSNLENKEDAIDKIIFGVGKP